MKNVTIVQRVLPHYRIDFFKQLRESLLDSGVNMTLIYGQHQHGTVPETVQVEYDWAVYIPNRYINVKNTELVYQNLPDTIKISDLVIVEQANRLLANYILLIRRFTGRVKVAYWGHGMNFQTKGSNWFKDRLKKVMLTKVDWWFAYTAMSAEIVESEGFPKNKISVLNNAIDNQSFERDLNNVKDEEVTELYQSLGINGSDVCLYCGGLYAEKQIEFLLNSAIHIRHENPQFELLVVGSGPDQDKIELAAIKYNWIHYAGPKYGNDRAKYFKAAKLLLVPGPIGLVVLDSFISKKPLLTTNIVGHGPEVSYLVNGFNGVMCAFDEIEYAKSVNNCLHDEILYYDLVHGCTVSATEFTMNKMVQNFKNGILRCLSYD